MNLEITISNRIRLRNFPEDLKEELCEKLIIVNPVYDSAVKSGRSTYGIDENIVSFNFLPDGSLIVPRGMLKTIIDYIEINKVDYSIKDDRSYFDYVDIDSSIIEYRPYQAEAVINITSSAQEGVLISPAGSGKTIMGLSIIAMLGQPTLWLTHTKPLATQAIERINKFLPGTGEVGMIGAGSWTKGDLITVGMIQTLVRNPEKLFEMRKDFGMVVVDECLVANTKILMLDGSIKDISAVEDGDITTFGRVTNKFFRNVNKVVELRGGWGRLTGTLTHKLPAVKYKSLVVDKHTGVFKPIKESDVEMCTISELERDDFLLIKEDGCHTEEHSIGVDLSRYIALYAPHDRKDAIYVPDIIEHATKEEIRNYIQVVFDTEGALNKNQITITMAESKFLIGIQHLLRKFGIMSRIIPIKKYNPNAKSEYLRLVMSGCDAVLFYHRIGFSMRRKQDELYEIIKRSKNSSIRVKYNGVIYRCVPILSKKVINGRTKVYDFTTEGHLFIANGVLSSNCHHVAARTFTDVVSRLAPYYMYGLTATPDRRDGLENLMYSYIGTEKSIVERSEVAKYGGVMRPIIRVVEFESEYVDGNDIQKILKKHVVDNYKRNMFIVSDIVREASSGKFCIVVSDRKDHCEKLFKYLSGKIDKVGIATGRYSKKHVDEQTALFNDGKITTLIATTSLLGEGFDVPFLDRLFITMPFRAAAKTEQLVGRIQRSFEGKKDAVVYDYVDKNIGVLMNQFKNRFGACRYRTYKKIGAIIEV